MKERTNLVTPTSSTTVLKTPGLAATTRGRPTRFVIMNRVITTDFGGTHRCTTIVKVGIAVITLFTILDNAITARRFNFTKCITTVTRYIVAVITFFKTTELILTVGTATVFANDIAIITLFTAFNKIVTANTDHATTTPHCIFVRSTANLPRIKARVPRRTIGTGTHFAFVGTGNTSYR